METFSTEIQDRCVILDDVIDIVRFSFRSRDSIAYLNLNLCEYSATENNSFFVSTEEKCRKIFAQSRSLLYNLHLDLPEGRESNLINSKSLFSFYFEDSIPHIGRIKTCCTLEHRIISGLVEEALEVTGQKLNILRLLLKPTLVTDDILFYLEPRIINNFIDCFYPEITDSDLFRCFCENFNLQEWMSELAQPKLLECLLYQVSHYVRYFEFSFPSLMDDCILSATLSNIAPILKHGDAPGFSIVLHAWYISEIPLLRPNLTKKKLEEAMRWIPLERISRIFQILWMFLNNTGSIYGDTEMPSEALRLIWSCIPDPCIIFEEFKTVVDEGLPDEELRNIYDFYCRSIGESHSCTEPRSLQHLSRTTVRRILCRNNVWIPEGVGQLGLPNSLQSYLNLE